MSEQFPYSFDFTPSQVKILPMIPGQSKVLPNGDVRAWFTREDWEDVLMLMQGILDGESNLFEEINNEVDNYELVL